MDQLYEQSFQLHAPLLKAVKESDGPLDSPLTIGLIIGGALLFLMIVLALAANYS
jgi:hypothetical protein